MSCGEDDCADDDQPLPDCSCPWSSLLRVLEISSELRLSILRVVSGGSLGVPHQSQKPPCEKTRIAQGIEETSRHPAGRAAAQFAVIYCKDDETNRWKECSQCICCAKKSG